MGKNCSVESEIGKSLELNIAPNPHHWFKAIRSSAFMCLGHHEKN
jgi:hypothetical protein